MNRADPSANKIVQATRATSALAGGLNRREQQADKNADHGNDDQQFDEREAAPAATHWR
jgi:hypothetical protein